MSEQTNQIHQGVTPAPQSAQTQPEELQDDLTLLQPPPPVPVMRLPEAGSQIYVWGAVVLTCLIVGLVIWHVGRRTNWAFRKPESPYERALRELKVWQALQDETQFREAIVGISGTLRRYVDGQFKLPAAQMTSEEFWVRQQASGLLPKEYEGFWEAFLPSTDRIKYAGYGVAAQQFQQLLKNAQAFVNDSAQAATVKRTMHSPDRKNHQRPDESAEARAA